MVKPYSSKKLTRSEQTALRLRVVVLQINVDYPEYLDHFFLDKSEYSLHPNDEEVIVGEYNLFNIISILPINKPPEEMSYFRIILEPMPHEKVTWADLEMHSA